MGQSINQLASKCLSYSPGFPGNAFRSSFPPFIDHPDVASSLALLSFVHLLHPGGGLPNWRWYRRLPNTNACFQSTSQKRNLSLSFTHPGQCYDAFVVMCLVRLPSESTKRRLAHKVIDNGWRDFSNLCSPQDEFVCLVTAKVSIATIV